MTEDQPLKRYGIPETIALHDALVAELRARKAKREEHLAYGKAVRESARQSRTAHYAPRKRKP